LYTTAQMRSKLPKTAASGGPGAGEETAHFSGALAALARGDRAAYLVVYQGLVGTVRSVVAGQSIRAADAEDVVQQVMLKLFMRAGQFDPCRGEARTWATAIALHEVRTARRQRYRRREVSTDELTYELCAPLTLSPETALINRQYQDVVSVLLRDLSPEDEQLVLLSVSTARQNGPTARERKRLERARARLRKARDLHFSNDKG
jgi:RNA polymerase sigma factor (sigma-70 family)